MLSSQVSAKIIADSVSAVNGKRITTFELVYPRFIHSELMTHRMFSRNAMSSRAVPIEKMIEQVERNPAKPTHWGKNQPGMQAKEELTSTDLDVTIIGWYQAARSAAMHATALESCGAHKQIVNRILEPFQLMKTVLTSTEFENFFWLRNHEDSQPEIKKLAEKMLEALQNSNPVELEPGDWHVPYFGGGFLYKACGVPLEDVLAISSSCCAQVSYRLLDDSLEKARKVYERLVESVPVHSSPFEHCATPMGSSTNMQTEGVTALHKTLGYMSGNFSGWLQYRQFIGGSVVW